MRRHEHKNTYGYWAYNLWQDSWICSMFRHVWFHPQTNELLVAGLKEQGPRWQKWPPLFFLIIFSQRVYSKSVKVKVRVYSKSEFTQSQSKSKSKSRSGSKSEAKPFSNAIYLSKNVVSLTHQRMPFIHQRMLWVSYTKECYLLAKDFIQCHIILYTFFKNYMIYDHIIHIF